MSCGGGEEALVIEPVAGFAGLVAADEPRAAVIAQDLLANGGNAADAAVAMFFAMTVTLPSRVGLAGEGLCLVFDQGRRKAEQLVFLQPGGAGAGRRPAATRAMALLHARHGLMPWGSLIGPAEGLARFGHPISRAFAQDLVGAATLVARSPALSKLYRSADGRLAREGERVTQFELSTVLTGIRTQGAGYFYGGSFGEQLAAAMTAAGWPLSPAALRGTVPDLGQPLALETGNETLYFAAPPASDGLVAAQMWRVLSEIDDYASAELAERPRLLLEIERRTRADRGETGERLTTAYLRRLMSDASSSGWSVKGASPGYAAQRADKTWGAGFVVGDRWGNAVACSLTMNGPFGSAGFAGTTGILLPAAAAHSGEPAAAIMASNASGDARLALASADGTAATSAMVTTLLQVLIERQTLPQAVGQARVAWDDAAWVALHESALTSAAREALRAQGYKLLEIGPLGRVNGFHCPKGLVDYDGSCSLARDPRAWGLGIVVQ